MNSYKCPHCKTAVTFEGRAHMCVAVRSAHGEKQNAVTIYNPNIPNNKQQNQPGYMKRFGSRANRVRRSGAVAIWLAEQVAVKA